jgi:hypothetical protein
MNVTGDDIFGTAFPSSRFPTEAKKSLCEKLVAIMADPLSVVGMVSSRTAKRAKPGL